MKQFNLSYLTGVYLAINAISDAYILMDAPNCVYKKMEYIDKNHDFFCNFFDSNGFHRIAHTDATTESVIHNRNQPIENQLIKLSKYPKAGVVFLASMPMANLTGIQYDLILNNAQKTTQKDLIEIKGKNLSTDWLGGYAVSLLAIAKKIQLNDKQKKKNHVAIVGYLMDRNEGDHAGNLVQLERYLNALSLKLSSVWLNGTRYSDLANVNEAELIISLPYGREAARIVSQRTGAKLLEVDLPFGLKNTSDWILEIAQYFDKEAEAREFISNELKSVIPVLECVASEYFLNKNFSLIGDPYLLDSMIGAITELGGNIDKMIIYARDDYQRKMKNLQLVKEIYHEKSFNSSIVFESDIIIGNSEGLKLSSTKKQPYLQFGFPSNGWHCFSVYPFLGYKGFLGFANRIVNQFNSFVER